MRRVNTGGHGQSWIGKMAAKLYQLITLDARSLGINSVVRIRKQIQLSLRIKMPNFTCAVADCMSAVWRDKTKYHSMNLLGLDWCHQHSKHAVRPRARVRCMYVQ